VGTTILIIVFLLTTLANYLHWRQCKHLQQLQIPTSGWPALISTVWMIAIAISLILNFLDLVPASLITFIVGSFVATNQIYSIFARERRIKQNSKPSAQPVAN
jgi:hypothetical protein